MITDAFRSALFTFLLAIQLFTLLVNCITERPIIGIVCHEIDNKPPACYIAASYVKAVEASGARVAPIFLSRKEEYYKNMVRSLNGIVFPGGDAVEGTAGGYYEAAGYIFRYVQKLNSAGDHFPILGVCLGHEVLAGLSNGSMKKTLDSCPGVYGVMLRLQMTPDFRNSSLYRNIPDSVLDILTMQNVTANYHKMCVRPETKLQLPWRILSLNKDSDGKFFVSSMEMEGPIVGIQFHPEKNAFEWQKTHPSFEDGLLSSRYFYDWLVTESRKNNHSFPDSGQEQAALIYNFCPTFSGAGNTSVFTQKYIFGKSAPSAGSLLEPSRYLSIASLISLVLLTSNNI